MGLFDAFCDHVLCPIGSLIKDTVEGTASVVDSAVNTVIIDGVCGGIDKVIEVVQEHPVESALVAVAAVGTGGAAFAAAGPIAAAVGSTGLLGTASTGATISALSGAALESASLAALGGGALSAGGGGMVVGTGIVAAGGVATGAAVSGGALAVNKYAEES